MQIIGRAAGSQGLTNVPSSGDDDKRTGILAPQGVDLFKLLFTTKELLHVAISLFMVKYTINRHGEMANKCHFLI